MLDPRVHEYELKHHCKLLDFLGPGPGQDGFVLRSDRLSAVKFFDRSDRFDRESKVYQVLKLRGIYKVEGHNVPELINIDQTLLALEISIVDRPFVLDFAGAKLPDEVPDFEAHVLEDHLEHLKDLFGDHWADALHVVEMFRQATGFVLLDIHPGNIAFADDPA